MDLNEAKIRRLNESAMRQFTNTKFDFTGLKFEVAEECLRKYKVEYAPYFPMVVKQMKFMGSCEGRNKHLEDEFLKICDEVVLDTEVEELLQNIGFYKHKFAGQSVSMKFLKEQGHIKMVHNAVKNMQEHGVSVKKVKKLLKSVSGVVLNENQFRNISQRKSNRCKSVRKLEHPVGTESIYSTFDHEWGTGSIPHMA